MIYVPDKENYECFVVRSEDVIRAYEDVPKNNTEVVYRDYYYNSNYYYNDGVQSFSQYTTLPVCINNNNVTSDIYYRNDLADILIIFLIMSIFCFYIPIKIFTRIFRRFN